MSVTDQANVTNSDWDNFLVPIEGPELVFALVGPVGANLSIVSEELSKQLHRVGYKTHLVRVSELLHDLKGFRRLKTTKSEASRIDRHMDAGNAVREKLDRGDALALLSVGAIRNIRRGLTGDPKKESPHTAYILRSLKHPQEIETLRKVYGQGFTQISVYCPREERITFLAKSLAKSRSDTNVSDYRSDAERLIRRDEAEVGNEFGQNVRESFPEADVVIDARKRKSVEDALTRFINILFSHPFETPTRDEFGMYLAKGMSLRSADLSRQVGSVIVTEQCEVLATGCNEVPKAGGGQYWSDDHDDTRDFREGIDPNSQIKNEMLGELIEQIRPWLSDEMKNSSTQNLTDIALQNPNIKNTQFMNVLEFGRVVHAEMAALSEAARLGNPVRGATLYCTTFPCHNCARHIIASGISRVVYVEPYPKSRAAELYPDSIRVDEDGGDELVHFDSFVGIAPRRFRESFTGVKRKDDQGRAITWAEKSAKPKLERLVPAYLQIEVGVVSSLGKALVDAGLQ